ncbi:Pentatricopeptide repeat-containing protein [Escovopsis weberi]|uniref:Pentatricopeptide repeat-containing protein n=1 Tax=Escovopsis weberi TaxID=150374 RepID=A0A0M8MRS5_ESCWE|nr:Pentatricopeptide repeat-containing protein [Escovopsis weberi]
MCGDHSLYHDYLLEAVSRWQETDLKSSATWLADIYKTYGDMPGARPSIPLLRGMFDLFYPNNVAGLEQVYKDWHRAWGGLDRWGYEKFLKLYATAGDVQAVRGLWKRYVASYPELLTRARAFRSTMNVYAQVGDAAGAERELRLMKDKYGVRPDLDMWNILLKCYARTDDYQRVVSCFEEICKMYRPDSYTYAHVMTMAAKKGDLEATLAFFHRAQRDKVALSKEIAMSLVTVCCQNDRLLDAERILTELAARGVTSTGIWNQLINFNGKQGRLKKCYELLQLMKSFNVAWDHQTHEFLLRALVKVNQVHPAYRLLRSAIQEKVFPVGPEHFAIVMAGAARTGDFSLVEMVAAQLARAYESADFNAHTALMDAAFHKAPTSHRTRGMGKELIDMLRAMRDRRQEGDMSIAPVAGDLTALRKQTKHIGRAIRLLVELRDFSSAEELANLYAGVMGKHGQGEPLPPEVVSALMLGYLKDRKYRQIHKMWARTLDGVLARSRRQLGAAVFPAHQYDLARPLLVVARAFRQQNNGEGLLECIRRITAAGFKLTRSNWNLVVQYLAEMGQWEPAMEWCEKMLMPRWRGWRPPRRSLHERRLLQNTRVLQASRAAVLSLQRQWLKLRKLAAWSPAVSAKLAQVERLYPRLHHAFVTTDYESLTRVWEGSGGGGVGHTSLRRAAAELLRPFSHKELRAMEKSLVRRQKSDSKARLERKTAGFEAAQTRAHDAQAPAQARARAKRAREAKRKRDEAANPQEITIAIP